MAYFDLVDYALATLEENEEENEMKKEELMQEIDRKSRKHFKYKFENLRMLSKSELEMILRFIEGNAEVNNEHNGKSKGSKKHIEANKNNVRSGTN